MAESTTKTLRSRLLWGTAIATASVLIIFCASLYAIVSASSWRQFDDTLAMKARSLAALVEEDEDGVQVELPPAAFPEFSPSTRAEYFQLWAGNKSIASSESLGQASLNRVQDGSDPFFYHMMTLPDGRPGRGVYLKFNPRQEHDDRDRRDPPTTSTLVVARGTAEVERPLRELLLLLVVLSLVAIFLSVGILSWFVKRGLRPVDQLAGRIANVGESDLAARIDADGIPAELMPVASRLNELLTRLESAFNRERVFTADVAHELRTPLAGLRTMLEVSLSRPRDPQSYQETMTECLSVSRQMHQMVVNLLNLARADARQLHVTSEPVDVGELAKECWEPFAPMALSRQLQVQWGMPEGATINTDRSKLQVVLTNLLDNAVTYADAGGCIAIDALVQPDATTISVRNTGSHVPTEQVEHVFDRFWRGDASRSAVGQHYGLGLSLCRRLVALLNGSIQVQSQAGGDFTVTIVFPQSIPIRRG